MPIRRLRNGPALRLTLAFVALLFAFVLAAPSQAAPRSGEEILVQVFGWDSVHGGRPGLWYSHVASRVPDLAALGATHLWFPPPCRSVSQQGYLPGDYYDLGTNQNATFYGSEETLRRCLAAVRAHGMKALADIVINHRCAGKQDENGLWNVYHFPSGRAKWEKWAICKEDYKFDGRGSEDTGDGYEAAPDIDHYSERVRADIIDWMKWLKTVGFDGWRYDYSKGYGARYAGVYDAATRPDFSVGEYWTSMSYSNKQQGGMAYHRAYLEYDQNGHRQQLCDWLDATGKDAKTTTFDFTTKGVLQQAVLGEFWRLRDKDGKAPGLIGWWPARAVTFIDNHDTGSKQGHWPFPPNRVTQGYVYILTHPGIPCLFWEHIYDWNLRRTLGELVKIRKQFGVHAESPLAIERAENGLYACFVQGRAGTLAIKLGWLDWKPKEDGFSPLASGEQWCVWGKAAAKR